jgi:hypothetical protein
MKTPKKMFKSGLLLCVLCMAFVISCTNDEVLSSKTDENISLELRAEIDPVGHIVSEGNAPVQNASVIRNGVVIATSADDGSFDVKEAQLEAGDVLSFEQSDYVTVTKVLSDDTVLTIFMQKRAETVRIDSRKENKIKLDKGGYIIIPKNTLGIDDRPFRGEVDIQASYIDVTDSFELRSAPGSYIAQGEGGLVPLTSFGMIEIVATVPGKDIELDVVKGESITTAFPVLSPKDTPDVVNLYSFDEVTGYWELEGVLQNDGAVLLGEVTSIDSSWNADEPCSEALICVKVQVVFTNGNPGCGVAAEGISYQGFDGLHSIDASGYVELMVCPDSVFELQSCFPLCIPCPGPVYTTIIDLTTITTPPGPDGCIDIGVWTINN